MINSIKAWFERNINNSTWTNWGRNQSCTPLKICYPKTFDELKQFVLEAHHQRINVRAFGSGHSWSNLVPTSGYLINTHQLNRLLSIDTQKKQVRIEAGMTLHQLLNEIEQHGLAMSNLGRVTKQTVAGATATGTHGTGHTPTLASFITSIELLSADGTLHVISSEKNAHWLPAARLSLGALGVIYALTLQCEDSFVLEDHCYVAQFDELFNNYETLLKTNDYWMFEWNPYTGKALSYAWNRTKSRAKHSYWKKILSATHEAILNTLTVFSRPFPILNPLLTDLRFQLTAHEPTCAESAHVLTRPYLGMRYVECEMSIQLSDLPHAVEELKKMFKDYQSQKIYVPRVTFRFVSHEKGTLLSPTFDGDRVFISLVMPARSAFRLLFPDYQSRMARFKARPHWGKIHHMDHQLAKELYGNHLNEFLKIRNELDPKGLFLNNQIQSIV